MKKYKFKSYLFLLTNLLCIMSFAQATPASTSAAGSSMSVPVNTILCVIALVLLFIILILSSTVNSAIELYKQNKEKAKNASLKNIGILAGFILVSQTAFSQDAVAEAANAASSAATTANLYFWGFVMIIIVEIAVILFFIKTLRFLTGIEQLKKEKIAKGESKTIWETINQFKPLDAEGNMDTGHNYDGIRELDNITPPWFTVSFIATIIFALIYLYRYHVSETGLTQEQELAIEMKAAQVLQDSILKLEGNKIDENSVVLLTASSDIDAGAKIYTAQCGACHGNAGQGGVGPNLTDDYWIHGGSVKEVFKTIKYGYVDKGMKAWKDDFSAKQIAQLSSYVKSLRGSNPPGAKEKQGELYVEEKVGTATDSSSAK